MRRKEYIARLKSCLENGGLSAEETQEAVRYYDEIFLDAGEECEEDTAQQLGSPEELARQILFDNGIHADGQPHYYADNANYSSHEQSSQNNPFHDYYSQRDNSTGSQTAENSNAFYGSANNGFSGSTAQSKNSRILLILLIFLVFFPVIIPLGIALLAVSLAIVIAGIAGGFAASVAGIALLFTVPPAGVLCIGAGLILMGIGGLIVYPLVKFVWQLAVRLFNFVIGLIRKAMGVRS